MCGRILSRKYGLRFPPTCLRPLESARNVRDLHLLQILLNDGKGTWSRIQSHFAPWLLIASIQNTLLAIAIVEKEQHCSNIPVCARLKYMH